MDAVGLALFTVVSGGAAVLSKKRVWDAASERERKRNQRLKKATDAAVEAEKEAKHRERERRRIKQFRFREKRADAFVLKNALLQTLVGDCAVDISSLYEVEIVRESMELLLWYVDPTIKDVPGFDKNDPKVIKWKQSKFWWADEMYWHFTKIIVTQKFDGYDSDGVSCLDAIRMAIQNYPGDDSICTTAGRILLLVVKTFTSMSEGFVFIYMTPGGTLRDPRVSPLMWVQRHLSLIREVWSVVAGEVASRRSSCSALWSEIISMLAAEFTGWSTSSHDDSMDIDDDDDRSGRSENDICLHKKPRCS